MCDSSGGNYFSFVKVILKSNQAEVTSVKLVLSKYVKSFEIPTLRNSKDLLGFND